MIEIEHSRKATCITLRASGTLSRADFDRALPEIANAMVLAHSPLNMMVRLEDLSGLEIGALWEELKFGLEHVGAFGRIAVVGDMKLEEWAAKLVSLFVKSEIRYFDFDSEDAAKAWLT